MPCISNVLGVTKLEIHYVLIAHNDHDVYSETDSERLLEPD